MSKSALVVCLFGLVTAFSLAPAYGQSARTFVSASGNDASVSCTRALPCLTFANALGKTSAGGEINVLDPGDFGTVTINKSVSIYNEGVGEAGILTTATNAIVINAGATDTINLRGLNLNGQGGGLGVHVLVAGRLSIENCVIQQFGTGVNVATNTNNINVRIHNSTITNNTNGMSIQPGGFLANVAITHSRLDSNSGHGVLSNGAFGGISALAMTDSSASFNGTYGVIARSGAAAPGLVTLMRTTLVGNTQFGLQADKTAGTFAYASVGESLLVHNLAGTVQSVAGGTLFTFGTNQVIGSPGTFTVIEPLR